jgi:hypothetical protein
MCLDLDSTLIFSLQLEARKIEQYIKELLMGGVTIRMLKAATLNLSLSSDRQETLMAVRVSRALKAVEMSWERYARAAGSFSDWSVDRVKNHMVRELLSPKGVAHRLWDRSDDVLDLIRHRCEITINDPTEARIREMWPRGTKLTMNYLQDCGVTIAPEKEERVRNILSLHSAPAVAETFISQLKKLRDQGLYLQTPDGTSRHYKVVAALTTNAGRQRAIHHFDGSRLDRIIEREDVFTRHDFSRKGEIWGSQIPTCSSQQCRQSKKSMAKWRLL